MNMSGCDQRSTAPARKIGKLKRKTSGNDVRTITNKRTGAYQHEILQHEAALFAIAASFMSHPAAVQSDLRAAFASVDKAPAEIAHIEHMTLAVSPAQWRPDLDRRVDAHLAKFVAH